MRKAVAPYSKKKLLHKKYSYDDCQTGLRGSVSTQLSYK